MQHATDLVISAILTLLAWVLEAITAIEAFLAGLLGNAGLPHNAQVALLIIAGLMLLIFAARALSGVFAILLIILLALLIAHHLLPQMAVHGPPPHAGSVQI